VAAAYGRHCIRGNDVPGSVTDTPQDPAVPPAPDLANGFTLTNDPLTRDVADAVVFLASDLSVHVTGQVISIDGGQLAHIPTDVTTPGGAAAEVLTRGVTQLTPPTRR
jgi:NAD(P)-dependent dehydrogenase (short-subunit alcohol dehydrogenase family)